MKFRGLKANEIDVRVGSVGDGYATLLFYKDARCDMNILDETVGSENWQRDHKEVKGNLFCGVGIWDENKSQWIWKWDCGTESNTEKEKGEASDSFKRACFNLGIGRELYTAPRTKIKCKTLKDGNRFKLADSFEFWGAYVSDIEYVETQTQRTIHRVVIKKGNKVIFSWDDKSKTETAEEIAKRETINEGGVDFLEHLIEEVGSDKQKIMEFYKIESLYDMTVEQFNHCVKVLENKKGEE